MLPRRPLFGDRRFATALFDGMRGMGRLFQGAATLRPDSWRHRRARGGRRAAQSVCRLRDVGPQQSGREQQAQNLHPNAQACASGTPDLGRDYAAVTRSPARPRHHDQRQLRLRHDDDDETVFERTVEWGIQHGLTTATAHIQTPYPGTRLFAPSEAAGRILTRDWDPYDTRHVVYRPARLSPDALEHGYDRAYRDFYRWSSIARGALSTIR